MGYLLDTNTVIAAIAETERAVMRKLAIHRTEISISAIALHELYYGSFNSERIASNLGAIEALGLPILAFDVMDARISGEIRAALRRKGTPIGPYDVLIAGQSLARSLTVVTANVDEFARVPGLQIENWRDA